MSPPIVGSGTGGSGIGTKASATTSATTTSASASATTTNANMNAPKVSQAGVHDAFHATPGTAQPMPAVPEGKQTSIELLLKLRLATARADRLPKNVAGVLVDHDGKTTFRPADETFLELDVDAGDLPRNVLLVAHNKNGAYQLRNERAPSLKGTFTGIVDFVDGKPFLRDLLKQPPTFLPLDDKNLTDGTVLAAHVTDGAAVVDAVLAEGGSAVSRSWSVVAGVHLDPVFSPLALTEAKAIAAHPDVDDKALVDMTAEPFFAIDNHGSRDIDQCMRLTQKADGGFILDYALADMAHAVTPGMALFDETLERGASFYLPGVSIPMQPVDVCERGVSLNAHEEHRAVVIRVELDKDGNVKKTSTSRAKIKSQAQLTYSGVSAFLTSPKAGATGGRTGVDVDEHGVKVPGAVIDQLALFQSLGNALREKARARGVVDPDRREMRIGLDGARFFLHEADDDVASKLNAELSILANVAGAHMLADTGIPGIHAPAIFRIHPAPGPEKLDALRRELSAVVDANKAPSSWKWQKDESLARWVERLQKLPTTSREQALAGALQTQVLTIQVSSEYSRDPGLHSGLMVEGYGRFTAPMREAVGLISHATLVQLESLKRVRSLALVDDGALPALWVAMLTGALVPGADGLAKSAAALEGLRGDALATAAKTVLAALVSAPPYDKVAVDSVVNRALESGNAARMKQKQCDTASMRLLFDDLFLRDLHGVPTGDPAHPAPARAGTITSVSPGKITVRLYEPDVEVKLGRDDLPGETFVLDDDGAVLVCGDQRLLVGAEASIRATFHDGEKLHFALA